MKYLLSTLIILGGLAAAFGACWLAGHILSRFPDFLDGFFCADEGSAIMKMLGGMIFISAVLSLIAMAWLIVATIIALGRML